METKPISPAFQTFLREAPHHAKAWMEIVQKLGAASSLDSKTEAIAYTAVLAALGLESELMSHVKDSKKAGVSREDIKSAILLGLPAAGNIVVQALPLALKAFEEDSNGSI